MSHSIWRRGDPHTLLPHQGNAGINALGLCTEEACWEQQLRFPLIRLRPEWASLRHCPRCQSGMLALSNKESGCSAVLQDSWIPAPIKSCLGEALTPALHRISYLVGEQLRSLSDRLPSVTWDACFTSHRGSGATVQQPVWLSLEAFPARRPAIQPTVASICSSKFHPGGVEGAFAGYTALCLQSFLCPPCSSISL